MQRIAIAWNDRKKNPLQLLLAAVNTRKDDIRIYFFYFLTGDQTPALKREPRPQKSDFSELTTWMSFDTGCLQHPPGTISREWGAVASLEMGYGCPWRAVKERAVSTVGARSDSQACSNLIEGNRWPQSAFNKFIQHLLNTAALLLHIFFSTDLEIITFI